MTPFVGKMFCQDGTGVRHMEWVFFSKFEGCGTQPGAVRAEIVAAKRLCALKARKARRAQLCRAEEDRLVHLSRSEPSRTCRSAYRRRLLSACQNPDAAEAMICGHYARRIARDRESRSRQAGEEEDRLEVGAPSERVAELTRLAALLQQTSMDEEDGQAQVPQATGGSRQDRIAALASQLTDCRESLSDGYDRPAYSGADLGEKSTAQSPVAATGGRLERMYKMGLLKQRARSYGAASTLERHISIDISRRFGLSFRPTGAHQPEGDLECSALTQPCSDGDARTWDGGLCDGPTNTVESEQARREEMAWQNSRRYMLQERVPPFSLPLPKAACSLGGPHPCLAATRASGCGHEAVDTGHGKEVVGKEAWGKGVVVNQGGMWRHRARPSSLLRRQGGLAVASQSPAPMQHGADWHVIEA